MELFFLGIASAIVALFLEACAYLFFFMPEIAGKNYSPEITLSLGFLLSSAFIEELIKNSVLYKKIDFAYSPFRAALASFFLGLGFAIAEIVLLYFKSENQLLSSPFLLGGVVLVHLLTAMSAGYFLASQKQKDLIFLGESVILTTVIHFAYNYFVYLQT